MERTSSKIETQPPPIRISGLAHRTTKSTSESGRAVPRACEPTSATPTTSVFPRAQALICSSNSAVFMTVAQVIASASRSTRFRRDVRPRSPPSQFAVSVYPRHAGCKGDSACRQHTYRALATEGAKITKPSPPLLCSFVLFAAIQNTLFCCPVRTCVCGTGGENLVALPAGCARVAKTS